MQCVVKNLDQDLYDNHLIKWMEKHNFPLVPKEVFPEDTSIVAFIGDKPIAHVALYLPFNPDKTKLAYTAFYVRNPEASKEESAEAFNTIQRKIDEICREFKIDRIVSFSGNEALLNRMGAMGYNAIEPGHFMIRYIPNADMIRSMF